VSFNRVENVKRLGQFVSQFCWQIGHRFERFGSTVVDPAADLFRTECRVTTIAEPLAERRVGGVEQVRFPRQGCGRRGRGGGKDGQRGHGTERDEVS